MPKYSNQFKKLLPTISAIASYIESKVGGTVFPSDNKETKEVTFKWKKYNRKNMEMLSLNYAVSYLELETMVEPIAIARTIVDKIKKGIEDEHD